MSNSSWINIDEFPGNCGAEIIFNIEDVSSTDILRGIYNEHGEFALKYGEKPPAFYVFSDTIHRGQSGGQKLATFLKKKFPKCSMIRSAIKKNPNSGNRIAIWIWTPPQNFFKILKRMFDK